MSKKSLDIVMKIKSQVDKALPSSMSKIAKETNKLSKEMKTLKNAEKAYSKYEGLKKSRQETILQYKKQKAELNKLKKVKEANKKLSKSEEKIYRELSKDVKKLSKSMDKQRETSRKYRTELNKLPHSYKDVQKEIKKTMKLQEQSNAKQKIAGKVKGIKKKIGGIGKKGLAVAGKAVAGAAIAGTIAVGALGVGSAKSYVQFNGQMKRVQALSRASTEDFKLMENAAIKLGSTTSFTSKQAGEGMEFLALAGFKTNQIIEAMPGLLDLAAASGEDLGSVADIVSDNLSAFGLKAKDAGHFADVMALASSSTNTTVGMLGEAFSYTAAPAKALGVSVEETAAILGIMANNGIKASQGGTALRSALLNLSAPSKEAKEAIMDLGLKTKDNNGDFLGMEKIIGQLQGKFKGLTNVQQAAYAKSLFGKTAVSGMLSVINSAPGSIEKMTKELENSGGAAKKMANTILDGPNGALTLLSSAYDGAKISLGKKLMGAGTIKGIKTITSYISELSNVINGSFSDSPVNKFWQSVFNTTKDYINKFKTAIEPIKESLSNIFSNSDFKKTLGGIIKLIVKGVLIIINWVGKIMKFLEPVIKFLVDHKDQIAVFFGAFMIIGKIVGLVSWLTGSITGLVSIISAAGGIMSALGAGMAALGGPIVWIIALFALLAYTIYKNWDDIVALLGIAKEVFFELVNSIWLKVQEVFSLLPEPVQNFISWYMNIWKTLVGWYIGIWTNMFGSLKQIYSDFKNGNISFVEAIKRTFMVIPNAIKNTFTSAIELIKSKMQEVKEVIKLPKPPEWVVKIAGKIKDTIGIDGSHKNGLKNVPYDGYIAELHKGERVLTAPENQGYNAGLGAKYNLAKNSGSTNNISKSSTESKFIFNPSVTIKIESSDSGIEEKVNRLLDEKMKEYMRQFKEMMEGSDEPRTAF